MRILLMVVLLAVAAHADLGPGPIDTKWYMDNCSRAFRLEVNADGVATTVWDATSEHSYCAGMLHGIYGVVIDLYAKGPVIPLSIYQLNAIVVGWVKAHPGKDEFRASTQIFNALSEAFRRAPTQ